MTSIPLWAAIVTSVGLLAGSIFASIILFKNNNKNVAAQISTKIAELSVTEEANLRDDQRELINTLKTNTASYQDMVAEYAKAIINEAKTQTALAAIEAKNAAIEAKSATIEAKNALIEAELIKLRADFLELRADRDELLKKAACVPMLEDQVRERDKTIKQQVVTIKEQGKSIAELHDKLDTATALLEAAARGQERIEGAVSMSAMIEKLTAEKLTTEKLS